MTIKLFLDDERVAPKGFTNITTGEDLIKFLTTNTEVINVLTFDHDLGSGLTGYDTIKKLVTEYPKVFDNIQNIYFHSNNTVGRDNMWMYLVNAQDNGAINEDTVIHADYLQYNQGFLKSNRTGEKIF